MFSFMTILLKNALVVNLDPIGAYSGNLLIEGDKIADAGALDSAAASNYETVDCAGKVILPALTIGHTHLYSALAPGMPPPKQSPRNFEEILEQVWWKLDRALDEEAVYTSALVGAARAAMCGTGVLVDHHASPSCINGSLDLVRQAIDDVGLRGVLCYEVTDRNGAGGAKAGLEENGRFLGSCTGNGRFAGLVGAHASFTMSEKTLKECAELAEEKGVGIHIHAAEDPVDIEDSFRRCGLNLIQRLSNAGILRPGSIIAHCTHLSKESVSRLIDAECWMAHNTRSNMNNAVGYAPVTEMNRGKVALGTDGIDGDLFSESKTSYFKSRDADTGLGWNDCFGWATGAARLASEKLGVKLGSLEVGSQADLMILDYDRATPVTSENVLGHWFFGFSARNVESLMIGGRWVVKQREFANAKVVRELEKSASVASRVWKRFSEL
jgi:putative selenium metabolism protein SsnA